MKSKIRGSASDIWDSLVIFWLQKAWAPPFLQLSHQKHKQLVLQALADYIHLPLSLEDHPVVLRSLLQPRLYLHRRHLLTSPQRLQPSTQWQASWSPHAFENSVTLVDHIPWAKCCCKFERLPKPFGSALCADSEEISSYPANGADLLFITADSSVQLISSHRLLAKISYKCPLARSQ